MRRHEGTVALVTGAARGMGRSHALRLAAEGADILAVDLAGPVDGVTYPLSSPEDLDETRRLVEAFGQRIVTSRVDVRDHDGLREAVDAGVAELGRLDTVVVNAGICLIAPWDQITVEDFRTVLDINVTGAWNTVTVAAPHVVRSGGGAIVLISSVAGLKVQPFMVHYTASKFAVTGMAKAFAVELARDHVRVNSVHPTGVNTPMGAGAFPVQIGAALETNPRPGAMLMNMLDVDVLQPEDVSDTVSFLTSDEARYITAQAIAVDAGNSKF